jgi:peptidoglycan/LPS O-acetylase OafA/YrhL
MPRQIIDTESSRPAYQRRRFRRLVGAVLLLILLVAACWFVLYRPAHAQESRAAEGSASPLYLLEKKGVRNVRLTLGEMYAAA